MNVSQGLVLAALALIETSAAFTAWGAWLARRDGELEAGTTARVIMRELSKATVGLILVAILFRVLA